MTESAQKSKKNAKNKVNKVKSPDKKYPDLASSRFRIHYVIKNFHSIWIQNVLDSYARFNGYASTEAVSGKKKLRIQRYPDTCGLDSPKRGFTGLPKP